MMTRRFWIATLERVLRTFAQTLIATLGLGSVGLLEANWVEGLSISGGAALLALLTAVATYEVTGGRVGITERPRLTAAPLPTGAAGPAGGAAGAPGVAGTSGAPAGSPAGQELGRPGPA